MPIKCEDYGQACVMLLGGDLVGETAQAARRALEEAIHGRRTIDFVIDFEKTGFADSEGLETLLWMKRRCEEVFGKLRLVHLDDNCRKILEITRLEPRFECHADLASALRTMR